MGSGVLVTGQQMATALGATVGGTLHVSLAGSLSAVQAAVLVLALSVPRGRPERGDRPPGVTPSVLPSAG